MSAHDAQVYDSTTSMACFRIMLKNVIELNKTFHTYHWKLQEIAMV